MFRNAVRNNTNKKDIRHFTFQNMVEKFIKKKKAREKTKFRFMSFEQAD